MEKFVIEGGRKLQGSLKVTGAKNMALKALVAACLTDEPVTIHNIPLISDLHIMTEIIQEIGGSVTISDHTAVVHVPQIIKTRIGLDKAAEIRTSSMFVAPLLARAKEAIIPNPGGCRIGARPIDRVIDGLKALSTQIEYDSTDGYFHAKTEGLIGTQYAFSKNTHTGTETLLMASVLAKGKTIIENAAQESEVDELIDLLNAMGADVKREKPRTIVINGVEKLHGATFTVGPDRNELVTIACAAILTDGDVFIEGAVKKGIEPFLAKLTEAGGHFEEKDGGIRFFGGSELKPTNVTTSPFPGFMTDWQGPWAVLMTKAQGESTIHETVYEQRFGYVNQLKKMGAHMEFFEPEIESPGDLYNFNLSDDKHDNMHAVRIAGPTPLHNAVVKMTDLRAGATVVLGALIAKGDTIIFGVEHLDRGYEQFDKRLVVLGASIQRVQE